MKLSLNWLEKYIKVSLSPVQLGKLLTSIGLEVEAIVPVSLEVEKVVVGRVESVEKHPQADKLVVAKVTDGIRTYQVVCGAPNCKEGMKTAFAMEGASLLDDKGKRFEIKKGEIRGVMSEGMLCSGDELKISQESEGILELGDQYKEGADVASIFADTVFDIALTPNLGHCASYWGVVRELCASMELKRNFPEIAVKEEKESIADRVTVEVRDKARCPRYGCRLIRDVMVGPSPDWLQERLIASHVRPINNVVDVTNFVMLELGHPLHAFDFDKIAGETLIIRSAEEGETFTTLDDKERIMMEQDLLICDRERPLAIAGVMGGAHSEVSHSTRDVLLEAAYFQQRTVRKTSKRLALQTESSKRFERHVDPNGVLLALDRAAMLIQELAEGKVLRGVIDEKASTFSKIEIKCRLSRVNKILGTSLSLGEVENIFSRLDFEFSWDGQDLLEVKVPTYRGDLTSEIDLIEEVARLHGYGKIFSKSVTYQSSKQPSSSVFLFEREVRARMVTKGLQEFITCDLIGPTLSRVAKECLMEEDAIVRVINPTSQEQSELRTSLLPGLLQVVKYNADHENPSLAGFEIGRIHFKEEEKYKEHSMLAVVCSGWRRASHWKKKEEMWDFYALKGVIEGFFQQLGIEAVHFTNDQLPAFHLGRQASLYIQDLKLGTMGEIHPAILRRLDVKERVLFAEFNLQDLFQVSRRKVEMVPLPIYPSSTRDWTVTVGFEVPVQDVLREIQEAAQPLLEKVSLIAVYEGEQVKQGCKNLTFHFVYRDLERTVAQHTVDAEHEKIVQAVSAKF